MGRISRGSAVNEHYRHPYSIMSRMRRPLTMAHESSLPLLGPILPKQLEFR